MTELIQRTIYPEVPPRVEYSLTEKGMTLIPVLEMFCDWGLANVDHTKLERVLCEEELDT